MIYQLPELTKYADVVHAFSTRDAGNMSFKWDKKGEVVGNRKKWLDELGLNPENGVCAELIHNDGILVIGKKEMGSGILTRPTIKADGLITNTPGVFLMNVIGDCLSLLMFDPANKAIGLIHAGWQGTTQHIAMTAVETMEKVFNTNPKDLVIGLSPAIHQCCYSFENPEQLNNSKWRHFLKNSTDKLIHINNIGYNLYQLSEAGVRDENIFVSHHCTAHSDKFYSHYRDIKDKKSEARFAAIIGLK